MAEDCGLTIHQEPYEGKLSSHEVLAMHYELTGKTRLGSKWFGLRMCVEYEVVEWVTTDEAPRHSMDLHQYKQRSFWIR